MKYLSFVMLFTLVFSFSKDNDIAQKNNDKFEIIYCHEDTANCKKEYPNLRSLYTHKEKISVRLMFFESRISLYYNDELLFTNRDSLGSKELNERFFFSYKAKEVNGNFLFELHDLNEKYEFPLDVRYESLKIKRYSYLEYRRIYVLYSNHRI